MEQGILRFVKTKAMKDVKKLKAAEEALDTLKTVLTSGTTVTYVGSGTFYTADAQGFVNKLEWGNDDQYHGQHKKSVCQESYDEGYEDGLKAGKNNTDDRIK